MTKYDVCIIGSGPGGYVSAIRCAQLGMKTALIEKEAVLGGTCLNVGCIPSKALLDSTELYHQAKTNFNSHGILISEVTPDLKQMMDRKASVVKETVDGLSYLMKKNKIDVLHGTASFVNSQKIKISGESEIEIETNKTIIATGSVPSTPPSFNYDGKRVITSTEALSLHEIPENMVIIGAGVIGLELGSVYARLGTKVTFIEYMDQMLPGMDSECVRVLKRSFKELGFKFNLSHQVKSVAANEKEVTVKFESRKNGEAKEIKAAYCLISTGRQSFTKGLGLENTGVKTDKRGIIQVGEYLQTDDPHIHAIGDVVNGPMLAHKASDEGVLVAEYLNGQKPEINYSLIPGVVYTWPELASVGFSEQEIKDSGRKYKTGKFPFRALGRARASMDTDGLIKILADAETDEVLGVHMVGARVADIIMEAATIMEFKGSAEDIARICHPHPTFSEAVREAALDVNDEAIHS